MGAYISMEEFKDLEKGLVKKKPTIYQDIYKDIKDIKKTQKDIIDKLEYIENLIYKYKLKNKNYNYFYSDNSPID